MVTPVGAGEAVPAAGIHRKAVREKQQPLTAPFDWKTFFSGLLSAGVFFYVQKL
ncbi:hypothetical protein [Halobacillus litoralis]|uniref:hypothetical protein n=1 Tax=Halobacillus litoralis TaxID=45668 RepID=UPI001CD1E5CA|nr:hypothetical protein [Halobacillus litoralis]MCA1023538.1 hypothetical protein [Halobacillus litoralis]